MQRATQSEYVYTSDEIIQALRDYSRRHGLIVRGNCELILGSTVARLRVVESTVDVDPARVHTASRMDGGDAIDREVVGR